MKIVAIALISLLLCAPASADDVTISDFAACGWLLVELNHPQLDELAEMSLEYGVTAEQLWDQLPSQVQIIRELGVYGYALKAKESCRVLGFTVNLSQIKT